MLIQGALLARGASQTSMPSAYCYHIRKYTVGRGIGLIRGVAPDAHAHRQMPIREAHGSEYRQHRSNVLHVYMHNISKLPLATYSILVPVAHRDQR